MTIRLADRLLLILVMEAAVLIGFVAFAESAFGAWISPGWVAAAMITGWIVSPVVVFLPAFAARPERWTRAIGLVVLASGATSTLIRSHRASDITLILLGLALFTYAVRRAPDPVGEAGGVQAR